MIYDRKQQAELRRFLKDRRGRVRPADVGLAETGRRRVRGLRREEVAALAGIGASWYTALENGDAKGVSQATVLAVSEALRLSVFTQLARTRLRISPASSTALMRLFAAYGARLLPFDELCRDEILPACMLISPGYVR